MRKGEKEVNERLLKNLGKHGLKYALDTLRYELPLSSPISLYEELRIWLVKEFLRWKGDRIENWNDNDIDGVAEVLEDESLPYDLRLEVFKVMLDFYNKTRNEIGELIETLSHGTIASRIVKGLIILMENFEHFANIHEIRKELEDEKK